MFGATLLKSVVHGEYLKLIALWFPEVSEICEFVKGTGIHCQAFYRRIPENFCTATTIAIVFVVLEMWFNLLLQVVVKLLELIFWG